MSVWALIKHTSQLLKEHYIKELSDYIDLLLDAIALAFNFE